MTRSIALLSDIHGNTLALDAVLEDLRARGGAAETWVLGDLAALGYDPAGAVERLAGMPNARFIRGNTDRYLAAGERPGPSLQTIQTDSSKIEKALRLAASFAWTAGALASANWLDWLSGLPLDQRLTLPDGTRLLAVHASPGQDDGTGLGAFMSDAEMRPLLSGVEADLLLVGHTHIPFDRRIDNLRVINPGSVSNPFPPDLRAAYVVLYCDPTGVEVEFRRVDYDRQAAIDATRRRKHPSVDYITRHLRGEVDPD